MQKEVQLGPEAKVVLSIADAKVLVSVVYQGKQAGASVSVDLEVDQFAQLLKDAIPGQIDDTVIDLLVAAMKVI